MKTNSMLADVFASANDTAFGNPADTRAATAAPSQNQETPMADKSTAAAAQPKTDTVADLRAAYPGLVADIETAAKADGANAERARIQGILALPSNGHGALVATHIADGARTADNLATAILMAEKATRDTRLDNIKGVETVAGTVSPAPSAAGNNGSPTEKATTPEGWKHEYAASGNLQGEFATEADYVAFKKAEAAGKVRILRKTA